MEMQNLSDHSGRLTTQLSTCRVSSNPRCCWIMSISVINSLSNHANCSDCCDLYQAQAPISLKIPLSEYLILFALLLLRIGLPNATGKPLDARLAFTLNTCTCLRLLNLLLKYQLVSVRNLPRIFYYPLVTAFLALGYHVVCRFTAISGKSKTRKHL